MTSTIITETREQVLRIASHARLIAAALDAFPVDVEPPTHQNVAHYLDRPCLSWLLFASTDLDEQKTRAAAIIRAIGGKWEKQPGDLYAFASERNGVELDITVKREAVCSRVVTGSREVTKDVPDPAAPMVTLTETVEDVEWVCAPLLAEATA